MASITPVKNARTLVVAGTSNAAGATTRAALDLRSAHGGVLTVKIINGGTAPTVPPVCNVLIAHNNGATPELGSAGVYWKTYWSFSGDTVINSITEQSLVIDPSIMHLEVEFTGNTGQYVTVEAYFSELTSFLSA